MQTYKNKFQVPPGGRWFYTTPNGAFFESWSAQVDVERQVAAFYQANRQPVPDNLPALVEDHICKHSPPGFCNDLEHEGSLGITLFSVMKFTGVLFHRFTKSPEKFFVPLAQAECRAKTCLACSLNLRHMCTSCNGLREFGAALVSQRNTKYDSDLGVCRACGCLLSAKVHVNAQYLGETEASLAKTDPKCWLRKELNYGSVKNSG